MRRLLVCVAALTVLVLGIDASGFAQDAAKTEAQFKKLDKDGDGKLSESEEQAARDARMAQWKERDPDGYARFQERRKSAISRDASAPERDAAPQLP